MAEEETLEIVGQPSATVLSRGGSTRPAAFGKTTSKSFRSTKKKKKSPHVGPTVPKANLAAKKNATKEKPTDGNRVLIVLNSSNGDYLR